MKLEELQKFSGEVAEITYNNQRKRCYIKGLERKGEKDMLVFYEQGRRHVLPPEEIQGCEYRRDDSGFFLL